MYSRSTTSLAIQFLKTTPFSFLKSFLVIDFEKPALGKQSVKTKQQASGVV
jgi:hypothetical protein